MYKEIDSKLIINFIYLPTVYIGEYLVRNMSNKDIELFWYFIIKNIDISTGSKIGASICVYLGVKGDIETISKFIMLSRPKSLTFVNIAAVYATPVVCEQLKQLFDNLNKDHLRKYIWYCPNNSIYNAETSLKTLENASYLDDIGYLDDINMGAYPDIYFAFVDNITFNRMSLDQKKYYSMSMVIPKQLKFVVIEN